MDYPNEREARQLLLAVKIGVVLGVIATIAMILAYGVYDIQCPDGQHWSADAQECFAGADE